MTIVEWLRQNQSKYPAKETLIQSCIKNLKKPRGSVLDAYRMISKMTPSLKSNIGFSEKELRSKHDNMYKIRQGVKQLQKGRYLTDQQMKEFCQVSPSSWRGFSDNIEFDDYKIKVSGGVVYWGIPDSIRKLKEDLNVTF